jgi:hypothetical protein
MKEASIIGLDLAKRSFQAHGALADGSVAFERSSRARESSAFLPSGHAASSPWRPAGAHITGSGYRRRRT